MRAAASAGSASLTFVASKKNINSESAEQVRRLIAFGAAAVIGPLSTETLIVAPTVGTAAAAQRALENDSVAFFDLVDLGSVAAKPFDSRQDFVTENNRIRNLQLAMQVFDVRATN